MNAKACNVLAMLLLLAGCGSRPGFVLPSFKPYRMDIQQGNYVTQEMIQKVKPGMSSSQVRFALGTPLIVDPFHKDRWDYVYIYRKDGEITEQRHLTMIFKDDKLLRIEGDVVPAAAKSAAAEGGAEAKPAPKAAP